jgi:hypothetical protein
MIFRMSSHVRFGRVEGVPEEDLARKCIKLVYQMANRGTGNAYFGLQGVVSPLCLHTHPCISGRAA